jgi:predicted HicB family RNase H-like nuclease
MTLEEHDSEDKMSLLKARSHITIDITVSRELYRRMRAAANQDNLSLNEYIERTLGEAVPGEASLTQHQHRPMPREAIERLREIREKITQDRGGKPFEEDSAELIRQMREERSQYLEEL